MKDKEKAIRMLRDNIPIEDIVEATGYSRGYLYKLGSSNGIVLERVSINDYREQILYMIEQGKTYLEIGQAIGYSEITVHNCINDWKRAEKRKDESEEVEDYYPENILTFAEKKKPKGETVIEKVGNTYKRFTAYSAHEFVEYYGRM